MCGDRERSGENVLVAQNYCNGIRQDDMIHRMHWNNSFFFRGLNQF